jgi:hypothetical protein
MPDLSLNSVEPSALEANLRALPGEGVSIRFYFPSQLFNRCSQALECFILMLPCLEQSVSKMRVLTSSTFGTSSGNLAARDNPASIEYRASRRC